MKKTYSIIFLIFSFLTLSFLYMAYLVGTQKTSYIVIPEGNYSRVIDQEILFKEVNKFRVSEGLPKYSEDTRACEIAQTRVEDIQLEFSHKLFFSRVQQEEIVAENLSNGFNDEQSVVKAWVYSKKHRYNLLDSFKGSCIRCENRYCVQIFTNYEVH